MKGADRKVLILLGAFLIYSCEPILTRFAAGFDFLSAGYVAYLAAAVLVLAVYAVLWQQIIKRMPISDAYMFKGSTIVFVMILAHLIFGEAISLTNVIGAVLIIGGIAFYAKA